MPEWQSQYAVGLNKLAPHTYVWPYADASDIGKPGGYEQSPYYMSLNGKWKFNWVKNPDNRPKDFYQPSYYTGGWADINVPGNWERQGYGTAIYVNETYEFDDKMFNFKKNPPLVPSEENEVGSYRRTFTIPAGWEGRRVILCCEGVISFYYAWVNGEYKFKDEPLLFICKRLENYYNVQIHLNDPRLEQIRYTGTFSLEQDIMDVFRIIDYEKQFAFKRVKRDIFITHK